LTFYDIFALQTVCRRFRAILLNDYWPQVRTLAISTVEETGNPLSASLIISDNYAGTETVTITHSHVCQLPNDFTLVSYSFICGQFPWGGQGLKLFSKKKILQKNCQVQKIKRGEGKLVQKYKKLMFPSGMKYTEQSVPIPINILKNHKKSLIHFNWDISLKRIIVNFL
jgi:hypothetical protein